MDGNIRLRRFIVHYSPGTIGSAGHCAAHSDKHGKFGGLAMRFFAMKVFALLVVLFLFGSTAFAQGTALKGAVKDRSGAVIPGATLTLTYKATGTTRTALSGDSGDFLFLQLEPGNYRLSVSLTGFKTLVQDPLPVAIGVTSTYNAVLDVGQIEQEVVVEAGLAAVNTTDATLGNVISGVQVQNLPTESLDPAGLLSLQPGVTFVPGKADAVGGYSSIIDEDGRGGSVNGARSDQTNITLDGVDVNDPQNGFAFTSALRATQASLQEFRVTTSSYNADLGRSSGAQIQLVTKSGTNEIHGEAYYAHRNEAFAANDFFSNQDGVEKGKLRRHIYGFAMGGPLIKDRLFLFGNFERLEHIEESGVLRTVPSEAFRDGVLFYRCANESLCPGGSVRGFSNTHSVPQGFHGLTPAQAAAIDPLGIGAAPAIISYAKQYPMPNTTSGVGDGYNRVGFRFNAPVNNDFKTYIGRMDFNIDPQGNHTVYARGTLQDDAVVSSVAQFPGMPPNQTMLGNSRGLALGYKAIVSPTLLSNVRYGYTRIGEQFA
ncbi:MAG: carboxypeptidase regulatory-like domain-containing protein, partial [Acidobacteria bacterium]|nr:carboxypeptidase regulatory-like domain-containing protein [Acidobacteriota bacterium]